jgi:hypothetical protein
VEATASIDSNPAVLAVAPPLFTLSVEQAAWLAGFMDGEGYIGVGSKMRGGRKYYQGKIEIANTCLPVLEEIAALVNGNCLIKEGHNNRSNPRAKQSYQLWFNSAAIPCLLLQVLPYLRVKRVQAERMLEFCQIRGRERQRPAPTEAYERYYALFKTLNKRGV